MCKAKKFKPIIGMTCLAFIGDTIEWGVANNTLKYLQNTSSEVPLVNS